MGITPLNKSPKSHATGPKDKTKVSRDEMLIKIYLAANECCNCLCNIDRIRRRREACVSCCVTKREYWHRAVIRAPCVASLRALRPLIDGHSLTITHSRAVARWCWLLVNRERTKMKKLEAHNVTCYYRPHCYVFAFAIRKHRGYWVYIVRHW